LNINRPRCRSAQRPHTASTPRTETHSGCPCSGW